ncbi:MAG TPA: helix-turn-helix domain-containing protein, partial [Deinococcales bacterium]|nr:helix-turn-helix domain-containing protein [Deinococcales bacterium]
MSEPRSDFQPAESMVISDPETLRVLSDPLRLKLLQHNFGSPWAVKDAAAALALPQTKLYYHVKLLEKHGLIRVVASRVVSGIIEKHYQVTALQFQPHKSLFTPGGPDESVNSLITGVLDSARDNLVAALRSGLAVPSDDAPEGRKLLIQSGLVAFTREEADRFRSRLQDLIAEFNPQ